MDHFNLSSPRQSKIGEFTVFRQDLLLPIVGIDCSEEAWLQTTEDVFFALPVLGDSEDFCASDSDRPTAARGRLINDHSVPH